MLWWSLYFAAILITSTIQMNRAYEPLLGYKPVIKSDMLQLSREHNTQHCNIRTSHEAFPSNTS